MLLFLFTDIFCIFKSKTARYELRNLSNYAICPVLPGSDSLCSTLFCESRVRHVSYPLVGMVCAEQSRLGTDGSSFICGNGALGMEGRSRGVYSAGCIRRIVHAALFSAFVCFPLLMKGKSRMPLAIMAMGILFNVINATLLAASFLVVHCRESTNQPPSGQILYLG